MKRAFKSMNFRQATIETIAIADQIITEYAQQGYELTLRQLYYQFVARDLIPNSDKSYDKLGQAINNGRLAGLLDWNYIVDRTRSCRTANCWSDAASILHSAEHSFNMDKWENQDVQVEVWVEKEAMAQIIQKASEKWDVPWFCCRGYVSQSAMYEAAQRHIAYGKPVHVLHLGDLDPSGVDMTRDIDDRLWMFHASETTIHRIALNMDQIQEQKPPPNPAKLTDSRAKDYISMYGYQSWELDALSPAFLQELIDDNITNFIDPDEWDKAVEEQEHQRAWIRKARQEFENEE